MTSVYKKRVSKCKPLAAFRNAKNLLKTLKNHIFLFISKKRSVKKALNGKRTVTKNALNMVVYNIPL